MKNLWILLLDVIWTLWVYTFFILIEYGLVSEFKNVGFHCGDAKLSYKYKGDTVSAELLVVTAFIIPFIMCFLTEWFMKDDDRKDVCYLSSWKRIAFSWYSNYFLGLSITFFLTDIIKVVIGEPRPHFFDTCKPLEAINCSNEYFPKFTCTNVNKKLMRDSIRSFPSGHASLSTYFVIRLIWYLRQRFVCKSSTLVYTLQCFAFTWAIICTMTRITDNRHHWWDVLAGTLLGVTISTYFIFLKERSNFRRHRAKLKDEKILETTTDTNRTSLTDSSGSITRSLIQQNGIIIDRVANN